MTSQDSRKKEKLETRGYGWCYGPCIILELLKLLNLLINFSFTVLRPNLRCKGPFQFTACDEEYRTIPLTIRVRPDTVQP